MEGRAPNITFLTHNSQLCHRIARGSDQYSTCSISPDLGDGYSVVVVFVFTLTYTWSHEREADTVISGDRLSSHFVKV